MADWRFLMLWLRLTPRIARALRAWLACLVLGVAAAPASAAGLPDRIVVVSETTEQPASHDEDQAQPAVTRLLPQQGAPAPAGRAQPTWQRAQAPRVAATALYLQHCALLL